MDLQLLEKQAFETFNELQYKPSLCLQPEPALVRHRLWSRALEQSYQLRLQAAQRLLTPLSNEQAVQALMGEPHNDFNWTNVYTYWEYVHNPIRTMPEAPASWFKVPYYMRHHFLSRDWTCTFRSLYDFEGVISSTFLELLTMVKSHELFNYFGVIALEEAFNQTQGNTRGIVLGKLCKNPITQESGLDCRSNIVQSFFIGLVGSW